MEQDTFNRMLQTVQEIEGAVGYSILKLHTSYRPDGCIHEAAWCDASGNKVLWQTRPFTSEARYGVNEACYWRIVMTNFWE